MSVAWSHCEEAQAAQARDAHEQLKGNEESSTIKQLFLHIHIYEKTTLSTLFCIAVAVCRYRRRATHVLMPLHLTSGALHLLDTTYYVCKLISLRIYKCIYIYTYMPRTHVYTEAYMSTPAKMDIYMYIWCLQTECPMTFNMNIGILGVCSQGQRREQQLYEMFSSFPFLIPHLS